MSIPANARSKQSFKRAVQHLFRDLGDARALRTNPLTRRNFVAAADGGRIRDDGALAAIRSEILRAGYVCHSEDVTAGLTWRAARQLEILKGLCSRQSAADIAPYTLKTTWTLTVTGKDVSGGCCCGITHSATFVLTVQ